jgi:hypothetical protein
VEEDMTDLDLKIMMDRGDGIIKRRMQDTEYKMQKMQKDAGWW